jgi:hypothetical protein
MGVGSVSSLDRVDRGLDLRAHVGRERGAAGLLRGGLLAGVVRSDLKIPGVVYEALSIFLLLAIGLKGGVELSRHHVADLALPALVVVGAALLIPLFAPLAESLGLSPLVVTVVIAVAASCAFMLPVATPPNAIVFASGHIRQREMVRAGLVLNIVLSLVIAALAYFVGDILH